MVCGDAAGCHHDVSCVPVYLCASLWSEVDLVRSWWFFRELGLWILLGYRIRIISLRVKQQQLISGLEK